MAGTASPSTLRFDAPVRVPTQPDAQPRGPVGVRHSAVRLTRRGRVVVLAVLVSLLLAAFTLGRSDSQAAAGAGTERTRAPYASTTVHAGETLWSVAQRVAPGLDPRVVVEQLQSLNHLDGASLQVGQLLLLPHAA